MIEVDPRALDLDQGHQNQQQKNQQAKNEPLRLIQGLTNNQGSSCWSFKTLPNFIKYAYVLHTRVDRQFLYYQVIRELEIQLFLKTIRFELYLIGFLKSLG